MNDTANTAPVFQPEKLNLWDRFFNRHRKEVISRGQECWKRYRPGFWSSVYYIDYTRYWVEYRIVDRLTGSITLKREYLN